MSSLALSVTLVFGPKPTRPTPPARRRLAQNVVCLFAADRPPVVNARPRGRLPRGIARLEMPSFAIGDMAEIFYGGANPNNGKQIKIVGRNPVDGDFCVEAMSGILHTFDKDGKPNGSSARAQCPPKRLRRIPRLSRQREFA